jgi:ribosomal protein S27AE
MMTEQINRTCADHPNRFDCPDCLVAYSASSNFYGLIIHDGSESIIEIEHCPWCGSMLAVD